jgi:hypothetical protein
MPLYDRFRRSAAPPKVDDDPPAAPRILHRLLGLDYEPPNRPGHPLRDSQFVAIIIQDLHIASIPQLSELVHVPETRNVDLEPETQVLPRAILGVCGNTSLEV